MESFLFSNAHKPKTQQSYILEFKCYSPNMTRILIPLKESKYCKQSLLLTNTMFAIRSFQATTCNFDFQPISVSRKPHTINVSEINLREPRSRQSKWFQRWN